MPNEIDGRDEKILNRFDSYAGLYYSMAFCADKFGLVEYCS